jgi:broad specificity phosphatase PhoE
MVPDFKASPLWMLRHAPTSSNLNATFMGRLDVPATDEGLARAAALRQAFGGKFTKVFSSPLKRSAQTASASFPAETVEMDQRLQERSLGDWEGMPKDDVRRAYPDAFLPDGTMDASYTPPGGEELSTLRGRIASFLDFVLPSAANGPIIIVTHNGWIRTAQYLCGEIMLEQIYARSVEYLVPIPFSIKSSLASRPET